MTLYDLIPYLGAAFTAFCSLFILVGRLRGARPQRPYRWPERPTVRISDICLDNFELIDHVERAYSELQKLGAGLGPLVKGGMSTAVKGEIVISPRSQWFDPSHAGETRKIVSGATGFIEWAVCYLPSDAAYLVVLHELLHALGFEHVSMTGHALASSVDRIGDSLDGVAEALVS